MATIKAWASPAIQLPPGGRHRAVQSPFSQRPMRWAPAPSSA